MTAMIENAARSIRYRSRRAARRASQTIQRSLHRSRMPVLEPRDAHIVRSLEEEGACVTSLDELLVNGVAETETLFAKLVSVIAPMKNDVGVADSEYVVHASTKAIMEHAEILRWGLNERLLAIAENHLRLPVAFRGVAIRKDIANGRQTKTRYWHRDSEDSRIIKIIVYIEDVGPDDGPFCYIPKHATKHRHFEVFGGSRVSDVDMNRAVPERDRVRCTGPAGTVLFADTCSIWHRGETGTQNDRFAAFFCYNSQIPMRPETVTPLFPAAELTARFPDLTPPQRRAISYDYMEPADEREPDRR